MMVVLQAVTAPAATPWEWGWEAVAAIATAATFAGGLTVYTIDKALSWTATRRRKRVLASSLIHPLALTRNFFTAAKALLANKDVMLADPRGAGKALMHHEASQLREYRTAIIEYREVAAADFAYAVSLIESIDSFVYFLSEIPEPDEAQRKALIADLEFYAEAASQAAESLDAVESELKKYVPAHIWTRRFGERARWLSVAELSKQSRAQSKPGPATN